MCTERVTREMQKHHDDAKKRLMGIAAYETPQEAQERFKSVCHYGHMYTYQGFVWIDTVGCSAFNEYLSGCHCFVKWKLNPDQQTYVDDRNGKSIRDVYAELMEALEDLK